MKNNIVSILFTPATFKWIGIDSVDSRIDKIPGKDNIELFIKTVNF